MESLSQYWLQKGVVGWIFPGNSQPGAALLSAGDGHSPSFAPNLGLPSLLLRGWDSQLLPGQEDGEGHEEEKHLHPGAQVSLGLEENFPQPGQKVQRVPKGLVLGHRNWIFFFSSLTLKTGIWPLIPAGLGPEGSVLCTVFPITKEKEKKIK